MKSKFLSFTLLLAATVLLSSCLGDKEENVTTYYDSAIISFQLGTLNKYVTTTDASGKTTVTKTSVDCSKYAFYIDQVNHVIYNPDSLPVGLDVKHVIVKLTTKNSGVPTIKSMKSDSLSTYSSKDSINFETPRTFIVYNYSGKVSTTYTVKVNMHKQKAEDFAWNGKAVVNETLAALTDMKLLVCGDNMVLAGRQGGALKVLVTGQNEMNGWEEATPDFAADAHPQTDFASSGEKVYLLHGGKLYVSTDGKAWNEQGAADNVARLLGASGSRVYAQKADNSLVSMTEGDSWEKENMEDDAALLPQQNINMVALNTKTNSDVNYLVLVGNRADSYAADSTAFVWAKVEDNGKDAKAEPWSYYPIMLKNKYKVPRLANLQVAGYDNDLIALGGEGLGANKQKAFAGIYVSKDKGITWKIDKRMALPTDFKSSATQFAMTVDRQNFIWIVCGETGQVWKGRHAGKGWTSEQTKFEK